MARETGSSHVEGDGVVQQCPPQDVFKVNEQINGACSVCGHKPTRTGIVRFGDIHASGRSMVFQGDVHTVNCCQHIEPLLSTTRPEPSGHVETENVDEFAAQVNGGAGDSSETHSVRHGQFLTSRQTTQSPSDDGPAPTATGHDVRIGMGGPGSPDSVSGVSPEIQASPLELLTGLEVMTTRLRYSETWNDTYRAEPISATLCIKDVQTPGKRLSSAADFTPFIRKWNDCKISMGMNTKNGLRRLKITESDTSVLWVPETMIDISCKDERVVFSFSNCNRLHAAGHYETQRGVRMVVATYDPEHHNVDLEINFADGNSAAEFRDHLLCKEVVPDNSNREIVLKSQRTTTTLHFLPELAGGEQKPYVSIWKTHTDDRDEVTKETYDIVAMSGSFDLDVNASERELRIAVGYMDRFTYEPAHAPANLPQYVRLAADGRPAKTLWKGNESAASRLELVTTPTQDVKESMRNVAQIVNRILPDSLTWKLETIFTSVTINIPKMLLLRVYTGPAQVTLWSRAEKHNAARGVGDSVNHSVIVLIRVDPSLNSAQKPDGKSNENPNGMTDQVPYSGMIQWYSTTLQRSGDGPEAVFGNTSVTLRKVDCTEGNRLSTEDLRTLKNDHRNNKDDDKATSRDLELTFETTEEVKRFRSIVTDQHVTVKE